MRKYIYLVFFVMTGCAPAWYVQITQSIDEYNAVAHRVRLGDTIDTVRSILDPSQMSLATLTRARKQADYYMQDNKSIAILYYRSGLQGDGLTTDDEFTPYVFADGQLVSIGWRTLGGPVSIGQVDSHN